jgi:hypothetical protein
MAAKTVDARNRITRNHRFRGHGPLLQELGPFRRLVAHPPPCRSGPWPRKRSMQGNASTGTIAFAGMARSYKSLAHSNGGWRIHHPAIGRRPKAGAAAPLIGARCRRKGDIGAKRTRRDGAKSVSCGFRFGCVTSIDACAALTTLRRPRIPPARETLGMPIAETRPENSGVPSGLSRDVIFLPTSFIDRWRVSRPPCSRPALARRQPIADASVLERPPRRGTLCGVSRLHACSVDLRTLPRHAWPAGR